MARSRIYTKPSGAVFIVEEAASDVLDELRSASYDCDWVGIECVTGNELFPSEHTIIRIEDIYAIQDMSEEAWVFQCQLDTQRHRELMQGDGVTRLMNAQREDQEQ